MFVGRTSELSRLNELFAKKSSISVIYGRRRIGKSHLVNFFIRDKKHLKFQGLEGLKMEDQIASFTRDLRVQVKDPLINKMQFLSWQDVLDYLTEFFKKNPKTILFLDEFQWLAAQQSQLVSLLQKQWEAHWKNSGVMLILCGSISSYMVKRVIKSSAFFGRIDWAYSLPAFSPAEAKMLLKNKRNPHELFKYLLVLGGVPKYLESVNLKKSFEQNMNDLFFKRDSLFFNEYEKIFYSQFKEHLNYEKIVKALNKGPHSLNQIAKILKMPSGGGVKTYLDNLESALFISSYQPYDAQSNSKLRLYKLTDEYLRFYFKFILPNRKIIMDAGSGRDLFTFLTQKHWPPWAGFAFENFCLKNALFIAEKLGFAEKVLSYGPLFKRGDEAFQCDLIYTRSDQTITICELKFTASPVTTKVIPEVKAKCQKLKLKRGVTLEKALITQFTPETSLLEADFFEHVLTVENLFSDGR